MQSSQEHIARALVNEAFHSRRLVVGIFVFVNLALLVAGLLWPKSYTASTSILVDERTIIQPLMQGAAVATDALDRSKNAREIIFGRKIMDLVVEYGGWLKNKPSVTERELIIDEIKKRTVISTIGKNIIKIDYRDVDPERAFRVTEKFAELFMQESIAAKAAESSAAFNFIEKQTQEYQDKLTRTEEELKELRSATLDVGAGDGDVTKTLGDLNKRIEAATQELREAEAKEGLLERQVAGEADSTAVSARESQYRARIADLQSKLDTLRLSYHDTHPDIVQVKQQIQDLTDAMNAQRTRREQTKRSGGGEGDESAVNNPVYQGLRREQAQNEGQIEALNARIADLQRQVQTEIGRGKRMHTGDARLAELTRDYQVNRDIYQDLLRRRENARVSMNLDRERQGLSFKIQEPVALPQAPGGPRFLHFVLAGMLLGIAIPTGLLFARLQFDPRIRIGTAIAVANKLPIMTVVPHLWTPENLKNLRWELAVLVMLVVTSIAASATISLVRFTKGILT